MDIKKIPNNIIKRNIPSEFEQGKYDCSSLTNIFRKLLEKRYANFKNSQEIIKEFWSLMKPEIETRNYDYVYKNIRDFHYIEYIDAIDEMAEQIKIGEKTRDYLKKVNKLLSCYTRERSKKTFADDYLEAFYNLSTQGIFNPQNAVLTNCFFRKSNFLQDLIILFGEPIENNNNDSIHTMQRHYSYSLFDPFAYDSLQRILYNIVVFHEELCNENSINDITNLKKELLLRRAERAFNRFFFYSGKTFRTALNRHDSLLYASPYEDLSSIEEIKPIRLFEKIVTYIQKNIKTTANFGIKICIIGHTELSSDNKERELSDLLLSILNWFDRNKHIKQYFPNNKLNLCITNYININDCPISNFSSDKRIDLKYFLNGNVGECVIKKIDYKTEFCFNTNTLKTLIENNNIVFILDCPWLTTENYEIKKYSSLEYFCNTLSQRDRRDISLNKKNNIQYYMKTSDYLESTKSTTFKDLDSQFNRLMASKTTNAGEIIRVFNDNLIRKIENIVKKYDVNIEKKEVYIFSSETDGVNYSYTSTHPFTRQEKYEGKNITIIKFCNYQTEPLCLTKKQKVSFKIRLWSILKYLSVSFAHMQFKETIKNCFEDCVLSDNNYFDLYRSVIISIDVVDITSKIEMSLFFYDYINDLLKMVTKDNLKAKQIKYNLYNCIRSFVNELIKIVFSDKTNLFESSIRQGFLMNVYSAISSVEDMIYWHMFRMANINHSLNKFQISYIDEYDELRQYCTDEGYITDFFMDKKIYDTVLLSLEYSNDISIGIRSMLSDVKDMYTESNVYKSILYNICESCRRLNITNFPFYKNTKELLERTK